MNSEEGAKAFDLSPDLSPQPKMKENGRSLRLSLGQKGTESVYQNVKVQWRDDGISCFIALIFQPSFTLKRIWLIDDLEREKWTLEDSIIGESTTKLVVYGVQLTSEDGPMKLLKVLNSASFIQHSFQNSAVECETWQLDLHTHESSNSILSMGLYSLSGTLDELKVTTRFSPPVGYSVSLQEEFDGGRETMMFLGKDTDEYVIHTNMSSSGIRIPVTLQPRCSYHGFVIQITSAESSDMKSFLCQRASNVFTVKSVMSKDDLQRLQQKAEQHMTAEVRIPSKHEVKVMFRNKPKPIMDEIMDQHNGLMKKYIKDNNGDPYSPINKSIYGLFFSVSLDRVTNNLPNFSFFGSRRLHMPVEALFTADTNLYFTDFFCHRKAHYVTVVLTKKHSEADAFCQETLLQLDIENNPFLYKTSGPEVKVYTTWCLHVEVFYTEDVDITALQAQYGTDNVRFTDTRVLGKGKSFPDGIPKRSSCSVCNL